MKSKILLLGAATLLMSAWAQADNHEDEATSPGDEATIRLMELAEGGLPEAVTNEIELPEAVADDSPAVERTAARLATAIENLQRRDAGIATARGALAEALANQESRGRSSDNIPDPRPDTGPPTD